MTTRTQIREIERQKFYRFIPEVADAEDGDVLAFNSELQDWEPRPGVDYPPSNLIDNGSFVDHIGGWVPTADGVVVSYENSDSRLVGSGSLAVTVPANDGGSIPVGVMYRPGGAGSVALGGLSELDVVVHAKSDDTTSTIMTTVVFYSDEDGCDFVSSVESESTEVLNGTTWSACTLRHLPVPSGATYVLLLVKIPTATGDQPILVDDCYIGPVYGDIGGFPEADPASFPTNRIAGGDFSDGVGCSWTQNQGNETLTADEGALKVVTPGIATEEGVFYATPGHTVVEPDETVRLSFRAKGNGVVLDVWRSWRYPNTNAVVATITLGPDFISYHYDLIVPSDKQFVVLGFWTSTDHAEQGATFWIDDVSLGTP